MTTATLSTKYQLVIPKNIRSLLRWKPGLKFIFLPEPDGSLKIHPINIKNIRELRGFLKGIDTTIEREPDREL